jgi:hypothetical protein
MYSSKQTTQFNMVNRSISLPYLYILPLGEEFFKETDNNCKEIQKETKKIVQPLVKKKKICVYPELVLPKIE